MSLLLNLSKNQQNIRKLTTTLASVNLNHKTNVIYSIRPLFNLNIKRLNHTLLIKQHRYGDERRVIISSKFYTKNHLTTTTTTKIGTNINRRSPRFTKLLQIIEDSIEKRAEVNEILLKNAISAVATELSYYTDAKFLMDSIVYSTPSLKTSDKVDLLKDLWANLNSLNRNLFDNQQQQVSESLVYYNYLNCLSDINPKDDEFSRLATDLKANSNLETKYGELKLQFYEVLLKSFSLSGDLTSTNELVAQMNKESITLNLNMFNSLIFCYLKNDNEKQALKIHKPMKQRNLKPNSQTYLNMFKSCLCTNSQLTQENIDKFKQYHAQMRSEDGENVVILSDKERVDLLLSVINSNKQLDKQQFVDLFNELGVKSTNFMFFSLILRSLLNKTDFKQAFELFDYTLGGVEKELTIENKTSDDIHELQFEYANDFASSVSKYMPFNSDVINSLTKRTIDNKVLFKFYVDSLFYNYYVDCKYSNCIYLLKYLLDSGHLNSDSGYTIKNNHYVTAFFGCIYNFDKEMLHRLGEFLTLIKCNNHEFQYSLYLDDLRNPYETLTFEQIIDLNKHVFEQINDGIVGEHFKREFVQSQIVNLIEIDLKDIDEQMRSYENYTINTAYLLFDTVYRQMSSMYGEKYRNLLASKNVFKRLLYKIEQIYAKNSRDPNQLAKFQSLNEVVVSILADIKRVLEPNVVRFYLELFEFVKQFRSADESFNNFLNLLKNHEFKLESKDKLKELAIKLRLDAEQTKELLQFSFSLPTKEQFTQMKTDVIKTNSLQYLTNLHSLLGFIGVERLNIQYLYINKMLESKEMINTDKIIRLEPVLIGLMYTNMLNDINLIAKLMNFYLYDAKQRDKSVYLLNELKRLTSKTPKEQFKLNLTYLNDLLKTFVTRPNDKVLQDVLNIEGSMLKIEGKSTGIDDQLSVTIKELFGKVKSKEVNDLLMALYSNVCSESEENLYIGLIDHYLNENNFEKIKELHKKMINKDQTKGVKPSRNKYFAHFYLLDKFIEREDYGTLQELIDNTTQENSAITAVNDFLCSLIRNNCIEQGEELIKKQYNDTRKRFPICHERLTTNLLYLLRQENRDCVDFVKNLIYLMQKHKLDDNIDRYLFVLFDKLKQKKDETSINTLKNYYVSETGLKFPKILNDLLENKLDNSIKQKYYKFLAIDPLLYADTKTELIELWNVLPESDKYLSYLTKYEQLFTDVDRVKYLMELADKGHLEIIDKLIQHQSSRAAPQTSYCRFAYGLALVKQKRYQDLYLRMKNDATNLKDYIEVPYNNDDPVLFDKLESEYLVKLGTEAMPILKKIYDLAHVSIYPECRERSLISLARVFLLLDRYNLYKEIMNSFTYLPAGLFLTKIIKSSLLKDNLTRVNVILESINYRDGRTLLNIFDTIFFHHCKRNDINKLKEVVDQVKKSYRLNFNNLSKTVKEEIVRVYELNNLKCNIFDDYSQDKDNYNNKKYNSNNNMKKVI